MQYKSEIVTKMGKFDPTAVPKQDYHDSGTFFPPLRQPPEHRINIHQVPLQWGKTTKKVHNRRLGLGENGDLGC